MSQPDDRAAAVATSAMNGIFAVLAVLHRLGLLRRDHAEIVHAAMAHPLDDPAVADTEEIRYVRENLDQLFAEIVRSLDEKH